MYKYPHTYTICAIRNVAKINKFLVVEFWLIETLLAVECYNAVINIVVVGSKKKDPTANCARLKMLCH